MADSINPSGANTSSSDLLPNYYRTDANKKFLKATVDQLIQPGTVKKVNGYIGRQNSKSTSKEDIFVKSTTDSRQNYQLDPGLTVRDDLDNVTFFKDYQDYINQLGVFGANINNHARLNSQEFYSWDPHIDWDKFSNFQQYYWLPYGPDVIQIKGQQQNITSTYQIKIKENLGDNVYVFYPTGLIENPSIKLYRGQTYRFEISSTGHPLSIKTVRTSGIFDRYDVPNVSNHSVENGVIEFSVPYNSPDLLYYVSESDANVGGVFQILSIDENTFLDIDTTVLGKKSYILSNGTPLSNGMKVSFVGQVIPASYSKGNYYVEGVGESIELVPEATLELVSPYTENQSILFDTTPFDSTAWSDATSFPASKDYIVVNRGSKDRNPWSRHNRWFHKDVIESSANYNGKVADINQTARAVRPIIEFDANIKLFNFGTIAIDDVDLIDTYTTDVFSKVEGQLGYNIDGVDLAQGQRILFASDTDIRVKNKIYKVEFLTLDGVRQIHLVDQNEPVPYQTVVVKQGTTNQGLMYWFDGSDWNKAQQKSELNQAPLFDVFDSNGISFGDSSVYDGSTFKGCSVFSYKKSSGTVDTELGFPLSYKNINNIGDIVFNFNLATDTFQYKNNIDIITKQTNVGYLLLTTVDRTLEYITGWQTSQIRNSQAAVRIYKDLTKINDFNLDIFEDINDLEDLVVKVYVNGIRLGKTKWSISNKGYYKQLKLNSNLKTSDILTIRAFAKQPINQNGFYEIPINLQNNPLNTDIGDFTLGEINDHVNSIIDNLEIFEGDYPGVGNLRDLGNVTGFGTRFVQHSGPIGLSLYHLTSETNNIIRAIETSRDNYSKFKRNFIKAAESLGVDASPFKQVNLILQEINKNKPKTFSYYFSDMVPYTGFVHNDYTVLDGRIKTYPLTNAFDLDTLSFKSVLVYLNSEQLLYKKDYTFDDQGFAVIRADINEDDIISIYEYENTNGSFIPPTPTKLGIWPKYEPKIYLDTSLVTPRLMIQGHDGSQTLAYGDYRDAVILELEKRIFNNIKVEYDPEIFDIHDYIPTYARSTEYSRQEFDEVLAPNFYTWTNLINRDFTKPLSYDRGNSLTYNYRDFATPDGQTPLPGYWKGIHRWMLETDRPNICPWEMLGFTIEPTWWQEVYGPAPYTNDNLVLWNDLSNGLIREPGKPVKQNKKFIKTYLKDHIPVDQNGNIISPLDSGLASGIITNSTTGDFVFGDVSPVESAWRRNSHYPFSILITLLLLKPSKMFGLLLDRSRVIKNLSGQLIYKDTGLRITPTDIKLPSIYTSTSNVQTSGIINYIVDYISSDNLKSYDQYLNDLQNLKIQLSYRVSGFTSKEKFKLILDSKTPLTSGNVFIPQEDYDIVINTSSPIKKIIYSGVVITKLSDGYSVKGYSKTQPYFKYYQWTKTGPEINVGGISESFTIWTQNSQYSAGRVIAFSNRYYRVKSLHTTDDTFNPNYYTLLNSLPIVGGRNAYLRTTWDRTATITVPYSTKFKTVQEVVDFLLGYGEYLKDQGFIFDTFNKEMAVISNWESSSKEFMFWTTQNWSSGEDKWTEWISNQPVSIGDIIRYNGDYYRASYNIPPVSIFNSEDYSKLDGLSEIGSSVISVSPSAAGLTFKTPLAVVDDIRNPFNGYEIFKVDGTPIQPNFLNNYREDNLVNYTPLEDGIYGATFYLVQKEQVILLKNTTLFNDTIYNPESGYRQERIKVAGYVSTNWNGDFNIPGFIFDQAVVNQWESWKDYALGDIVKYKQFYYSAKSSTVGSLIFSASDWIKLDKKPEAQLLPNWTYKATQFSDFYSLDSDNFDSTQQAVAQHLVGYQKRQYLTNIIQDDVSEFKFYQGMIVEKGTQNVLNKLFDVLSADGQESIKFYEEWALRVGQYGASGSFETIEFQIDEQLVRNNPQGFELVNNIDPSIVDFIIRQTTTDVYLKPVAYDNNPWPILSSNDNYLRTPGYVRTNEVKLVLKYFEDLLNYTPADFLDGDYVWVGFEGREWNVYRFARLTSDVKTILYTPGTLTITLAKAVAIDVGSFIAIDQTASYNGFYKIISVSGAVITAAASFKEQPKDFKDQIKVTLGYFYSHRVESIDLADTIRKLPFNKNELIWTDNDGTNKWATWQYNPVYELGEIVNTAPSSGFAYGRHILLNNAGNISAVSTGAGEIIIYDKVSPFAPWIQRQIITVPFISKNAENGYNATLESSTGDVIAISSDSQWLATGTPLATNVSSRFKGVWSSAATYVVGDIVVKSSKPYVAIIPVPANKSPDTISWSSSAPLVGTNITGIGTGANFNVTWTTGKYTVTINSTGNNYAVGDTLRLFGASLNGTSPTNDIIIEITAISDGANFGPIGAFVSTGNARVYWEEISYIPVDTTGDNSSLEHQGVVSIYRKDSNNIFSLVATVLSPLPTTNEKFGSSIVFGDNVIFVGATGYNSNKGIVYKLAYNTIVKARSTYKKVGSSDRTIALTNTLLIKEGMYLKGIGFLSNQYVSSVNITNNTITISAPPDEDPGGIIEFVLDSWKYDTTNYLTLSSLVDSNFGSVLSISSDNSRLLVSAPGDLTNYGKVFVYKNTAGVYSLYQTISSTEIDFGTSTTVSSTGEYIAISSIFSDGNELDQGTVIIYEDSGISYSVYQELSNLRPELAQFFGTKIAFMNDAKTLVVFSQGADNKLPVAFDAGQTTFDNNLTKIIENTIDSGRIDIYDRYSSKWIFSESLTNGGDITTGYSAGLAVGSDQVLVGAPYALDQGYKSGRIHEYRKKPNTFSWNILHRQADKVNLAKIKRAFLYNKSTNKLVTYLDVVDSTQGKIPGIADQEIKYKTFYDPATYSSGTNEVNVDEGMAWTKPHVGTLWWDLRTAKFFDSHDENLVYRNSTWNTLFPNATIDVYEWVETKYTPDQWNNLADTEEGSAVGISGTSLYSNNVYALVRKYDSVAKTFRNTYYFWVKNKKTVPNVAGRKISAQEVSNLIGNPRGYNYKYLALTGSNSFSLVNVKSLLEDKNVVLSVEYWTGPYTDKNIHSQWKIINNNPETVLPSTIEQKWFDSLCGKDIAGRIVPDTALPPKLKYGIENRPRQSMFINRFEALKQFIEYVNNVLITELIVENKDTSKLESFDSYPDYVTLDDGTTILPSGLYDTTIDTDVELRFANIGTYEKPEFSATVTNGRITGINVIQRGRGYVIPPYFDIFGTGTGAKARAKLNTKGQIIGAEIIDGGTGYGTSTTVTLRNYSVLVYSDSSANGTWSIYAYEPTTQVWSRVQSQAYDVRKYWNYTDWYAIGYNEFTAIDYSVSTFVELTDIESSVGQLVKVRTTNLGTWILLEKYSDSPSVDWTQSYKVVGREKGTIQFSSSLYKFSGTSYGFDGSLYDSGIFDDSASAELRIILNSLKADILTDTLKDDYLNLFFNSVRYAFSEQNYIDWIFKTSFIKAQHNVGELKEKVTYNNDNLENFEDYIDEVKPYRTKIREYVSAYSKLDQSQLSTTDFDLPSVYEDGKLLPVTVNLVDGIILADSNKILEYPWKHWYDNLGYSIISLKIVDGGSGYRAEPTVKIISNTGSGATGRAFFTNGKVNRVILLTKGSGYLSAPTVVIEGGLIDGGTPARAVAIIGNGQVRSNLVKVKFDRINQGYFITTLEETETIQGDSLVSGSRLQFSLKWAPDVRIGKTRVLVGPAGRQVEALRSTYKLAIIKSTSLGYTAYSGSLTFNVAPVKGDIITVTYIKDWSVLSASDRIQHYYNPAEGELGKDLAQLMTGIDYGGVSVHGLNFDVASGWGSVPYYSDKWDSFDTTFDDYIVTVAAGTHSFTLPYVPAQGSEMNVYYVGKNVETYTGNGYALIYNFSLDDVYPPTATVLITLSFDDAATTVNVAGSDTIKMDSVAGINLGDIVTTVEPAGIATATNATGNKITLSSVAGLVLNEKIIFKGTGFGGLIAGTYYVKTIDSNTITVSLQPNGATLPFTTASGSLPFAATNTFGLNTTVESINVITKTVKLNQIFYKDIKPSASAVFTKILVDPIDCTINPNGTLFLKDPIQVGAQLKIEAYTSPIRLDDPNYNITGTAKNALQDLQDEYNLLVEDYNNLIDDKNNLEMQLSDYTTNLSSKQSQLNALLVVLDGLSPGDPEYISTASDINILVVITIPAIESDIDDTSNDLLAVNSDIAANISTKADKQLEIDDAVDYLNSLTPLANESAIMQTLISNGVADNLIDPTYKTFSIPGTFSVYEGDRFVWRKSGSDGSLLPQEQDYDTALSGGNFLASNLTSATGLASDDIIVDGDGFVTATSSPATEEVVPGQVVDSVAIKVYDRPNTGSANIKVDSYVADGIQTDFTISQQPNTPTAVIVKFTNGATDTVTGNLVSTSEIQTLGTDYTINYASRQIKFITPPPAGELVSIFSFGFNGSDIIDLDYFIGDGTTTEFVTKAPWVSQNVNYLVYVNGLPAEPGTPAIFKTDSSYESANRTGLYFSVAPSAGALINYVIVSGSEQTYSLTKTETLQGTGSNLYDLINIVGDSLPYESNMLVRVNQKYLQGPVNVYYTITGTRVNYAIDVAKFAPYSLSINDIYVYAGGDLLASGVDYIVELSGITVKINQSVRKNYLNQTLIISVKQGQAYTYIPAASSTPSKRVISAIIGNPGAYKNQPEVVFSNPTLSGGQPATGKILSRAKTANVYEQGTTAYQANQLVTVTTSNGSSTWKVILDSTINVTINSTQSGGIIRLASPISLIKGTSIRTSSTIAGGGIAPSTVYYLTQDVSSSTDLKVATSFADAMVETETVFSSPGLVTGLKVATVGLQANTVDKLVVTDPGAYEILDSGPVDTTSNNSATGLRIIITYEATEFVVINKGSGYFGTANIALGPLQSVTIRDIVMEEDGNYFSATGPKIQFIENYTSSDLIEVVTSYKHNILDIQRTGINVTTRLTLTPDTPEFYSYKSVTGGTIKLDRSVIDDNFVWVIKNGTLLTPSADFKLNEDRQSIKLAFYPEVDDEFTIITFGGNVITSSISYMQFKDMLNRRIFKRLNANKRTTLVKSLAYTDTTIEVQDASNFDAPSIPNNKPGIIEIRGERIEFFTLVPKVEGVTTTYLLGQLRRGTLGTGVSKIHKSGSYVQDIGGSETIPYTESSIVEQVTSDGTNIITLPFVPTKTDTTWSYTSGFVSSIPAGYGQADDIEVFVGGYASLPWTENVSYKIDDIVEVGSYTYRCIVAHTSSALFIKDKSNWTFFVGNIRLKKKPYKVHNVTESPISPAGDVQLDAEFSVDGESKEIRLTNKLAFGTRVTVIKRTGTDWDSTTSILEDNSKISRFLKAAPGIWYSTIGKYENKSGTASSFDRTDGTFDSPSITFDQG